MSSYEIQSRSNQTGTLFNDDHNGVRIGVLRQNPGGQHSIGFVEYESIRNRRREQRDESIENRGNDQRTGKQQRHNGKVRFIYNNK